MKKQKRRVIKSDINRVLLTETTPYEVPLIFSNEGFYKWIYRLENKDCVSDVTRNVIKGQVLKKNEVRLPFNYEISKNSTSTRLLSLPHPSSQLDAVDLYNDFGSLITHICRENLTSLRRPVGFSSTYYINDPKFFNPDTKSNEGERRSESFFKKYPSSFFSYERYSFISNFFNSRYFLSLELDYAYLRCLDISNCFGSIYTHSVSWSLKPKLKVKELISVGKPTGGLDEVFDRIMQRMNHNETNGIIVGPEFSRVFSELVFSKIDKLINQSLEQAEINDVVHVLRYVDDYFIFSKKENLLNEVELLISRILREYKLGLNQDKRIDFEVPFVTSGTKSKHYIKNFRGYIEDRISSDIHHCVVSQSLLYKEILRSVRVYTVDSGSSIVDSCKITLNEMNGILVDFKRIFSPEEKVRSPFLSRKYSMYRRDADCFKNLFVALKVLVEVSVYFFSQVRDVRSSHLLSQNIVFSLDILSMYSNRYDIDIDICSSYVRELKFFSASKIFPLVLESFSFHPVEHSNVIALLNYLGDDYIIPPQNFDELFKLGNMNYFTAVSYLHYFGGKIVYENKLDKLCKIISSNLLSPSGKRTPKFKNKVNESEMVHLFFDFIACPYVNRKYKKQVVAAFLNLQNAQADIETIVSELEAEDWFINWTEIDFRNLLYKKELKATY